MSEHIRVEMRLVLVCSPDLNSSTRRVIPYYYGSESSSLYTCNTSWRSVHYMILNKPLVRFTTVHYQSAVRMISFAQVLTAQWSDTIPCRNIRFQVRITSHDIPFQQKYVMHPALYGLDWDRFQGFWHVLQLQFLGGVTFVDMLLQIALVRSTEICRYASVDWTRSICGWFWLISYRVMKCYWCDYPQITSCRLNQFGLWSRISAYLIYNPSNQSGSICGVRSTTSWVFVDMSYNILSLFHDPAITQH